MDDDYDVLRMGSLEIVRSSAQRLLSAPLVKPPFNTAHNRLLQQLLNRTNEQEFQIRPFSVIQTAETWIPVPGIQIIRNDHPGMWNRQNPRGMDVLAHIVFSNPDQNDDDWEILVDFLGEEDVRKLFVVDLVDNVVAEIDHVHNTRVIYGIDEELYLQFLGKKASFAQLLF